MAAKFSLSAWRVSKKAGLGYLMPELDGKPTSPLTSQKMKSQPTTHSGLLFTCPKFAAHFQGGLICITCQPDLPANQPKMKRPPANLPLPLPASFLTPKLVAPSGSLSRRLQSALHELSEGAHLSATDSWIGGLGYCNGKPNLISPKVKSLKIQPNGSRGGIPIILQPQFIKSGG